MMEVLKELTETGLKLGLLGEDLRKFVSEQQSIWRDERARERDAQTQARDDEHHHQMELLAARAKAGVAGVRDAKESKGPKPPKLPYFNELHDDMDAYIQRFERYATAQKWSKEQWAVNLSALLKGKALEVYARLPVEDSLDYDSLKTALLERFELTEEGFKKKFRFSKPDVGETFVQFSARLKNYISR